MTLVLLGKGMAMMLVLLGAGIVLIIGVGIGTMLGVPTSGAGSSNCKSWTGREERCSSTVHMGYDIGLCRTSGSSIAV